jgi:hypothetical protein
MRTRPSRLACFLTAALLSAPLACADHAPSVARDFDADPAVLDLPQPATLIAVSDVHGGYDRLVALLAAHHVVEAAPASPAEARWAAGSAALVVAGDLFDKGPKGLEVIDLLRALADDAAKQGGSVIVLLGNHEAEFLADPGNGKADGDDGIDVELRHDGLDPAVFARSDPRAAWLAARPFAAKVGSWFFAHSGDTGGKSAAELAHDIESGLLAHGWSDDAITGATSILESRDWWSESPDVGARYAAALGARHLVFGHDPHALGAEGAIARSDDGALFRVDCGMSPDVDYSAGELLRVAHLDTGDTAEALLPDGSTVMLWQGE